MATEIAKAYVQLVPSAKGFKGGIKSAIGGDVSSAGEEAGGTYGTAMIGKLKGMIAAAGIGAIVKQAFDAGGDLQQSFGGLDTLYEDASSSAKKYARDAVAAGISMNDYAEQAVSFGAALKQSLGGDVKAAAEAANTAILDMADNSAKMGTPLEQIQSAYQGFAKGQYMLLDNLKLGYGGTKGEMERLLKDAEKLHEETTGEVTHYDINNLGDVYAAIHDVQDNLGLTGVAAHEAETTLTGSFQAMQASVTNLLADLTTGASPEQIAADISTLFEQGFNFAAKNLIPMAGSIITSLPDVITNVIQSATDLVKQLADDPSAMIDVAVNTIINLAEALLTNLPYLIEAVLQLVFEMDKALISYDWLEAAKKLIGALAKGLLIAIPLLIKTVVTLVKSVHDKFVNADWNGTGANIIQGILAGLKKAAHLIWEYMKELANSCLDAIKDALGIHSPSRKFRDEVGRWIPEGIGVGIRMYNESALEPMDELSKNLVSKLDIDDLDIEPRDNGPSTGGFNYNQTVNIQTTDNSADEMARKIRLESMYGLMIDEPTWEPA